MGSGAEERLKAMGLQPPPPPAALANYVPSILSGSVLYISGQISRYADGRVLGGQLGVNLTVEQGQEAARLSALNILSAAAAALGGLDRIGQVARLNGFVAAAPDFTDHPKVMNGASDLIAEVLGEPGRHTRVAVGVASLPAGAATEIDAVIIVRHG